MRPLVLRLAGLSAAIAFVLFAEGAQVARASCGDYLSHNAAMPAGPASSQERVPAPTPKPCQGPNCSGNEPIPVEPVVPPATEHDQSAALIAQIGVIAPPLGDQALGTSISFSNLVLSDIFHPPR